MNTIKTIQPVDIQDKKQVPSDTRTCESTKKKKFDTLLDNRKTIKWFIHGAVGWAKSITGVQTVNPQKRNARLAICIKCSELVGNPLRAKYYVRCELCGCVVWHKTNLTAESCPKGKW